MYKKLKRFGALFIVAVMLFCMLPVSAFADDEGEVAAPAAAVSAPAVAPAAAPAPAAPAATESASSSGSSSGTAAAASSGAAGSAASAGASSTPEAAPAASAPAPAASEGAALPSGNTGASTASGAAAPSAASEGVTPSETTASPAFSGEGATPASESLSANTADTESSSGAAASESDNSTDSAAAASADTTETTDAPAASEAEKPEETNPAARKAGTAETVSADEEQHTAVVSAEEAKENVKESSEQEQAQGAQTVTNIPAAVDEPDTANAPVLKTMSFNLASPMLATSTGSNDTVTVTITNIIRADNKNGKDENGHLTPYDTKWADIVKNASKGITNSNQGAIATRLPYNVSDFGVKYCYESGRIVLNQSENDGPVLIQTQEQLAAIEDSFIKRIANKGNGTVVITYQNGNTETLTEVSSLSISPVYTVSPQWLLEEKYVDNISTGSGSWSNLDSIESYTHTFKKPDAVTDYEFRYWMSEDTGEQYKEGDKLTYSSTTITFKDTDEKETVVLPDGKTVEVPKKTEEIDAYWQPAAGVDYSVNGSLDEEHSQRSFTEDLKVYNYTPEDIEDARFEGWYEDEDFETRFDEGAEVSLPAVTNLAGTAEIIKAYARYVIDLAVSKIWNDGNNADGIRPNSIQVDLYAGEGENRQKTDLSVILNSANNWSSLFEKLTAFDIGGNRIVYSLEESVIPNGYTASVVQTGNSVTITNSHTPTPVVPVVPDPTPDPDPVPNPGPELNPVPELVIPGPVPEPEPDHVPVPDPVVTAERAEEMATPMALSEEIEEDATPLAGNDSWALVNLIAAILTLALAVGMSITFFRTNEENEEEIGNVKVENKNSENAKTEPERTERKWSKFMGLIPGVGSVITFLLTEDMRLPMALVDKWTILMIAFLAVGAALAFLSRNGKNEPETEEAENTPVQA